jgi:hypothetical protein
MYSQNKIDYIPTTTLFDIRASLGISHMYHYIFMLQDPFRDSLILFKNTVYLTY